MRSGNKKFLQSFVGKVRIKYLRDLGVDWRDLLNFKKVCENAHWIYMAQNKAWSSVKTIIDLPVS
jgi:hypothetical protein